MTISLTTLYNNNNNMHGQVSKMTDSRIDQLIRSHLKKRENIITSWHCSWLHNITFEIFLGLDGEEKHRAESCTNQRV